MRCNALKNLAFKFFFLLCLALVTSRSADAVDIYVNNVGGDDHFSGAAAQNTGALQGPVRTISRALRIAEKGDRLILAKSDVPYREEISLCTGKQWGYPHRPFTIQGNGAILDGTLEVPPSAWQYVDGETFRFQPARLDYANLFIGGKPAQRRYVTYEGGVPKLETGDWMLRGPYIYFRSPREALPGAFNISYAAYQTGITLYQVRHVRIENLTVQGFRLDGINAADTVYDCTLDGVLCRGNGRSGLTVAGASKVRVERSTFGDNRDSQIRTEGFGQLELKSSELVDNVSPAQDVAGGRLFIDGKLQSPGRSDWKPE